MEEQEIRETDWVDLYEKKSNCLSLNSCPFSGFGMYAPVADIIVSEGAIYTVDSDLPQAEAFAVKDGRFVAVGSVGNVMPYRGSSTRFIEFPNYTIYPGFTDAHAHLYSLGRFLSEVNLVGVTSYPEMVSKVRQSADKTPKGEWIFGRGWDETF